MDSATQGQEIVPVAVRGDGQAQLVKWVITSTFIAIYITVFHTLKR